MDNAPPSKNGGTVSNTRLYLGNLPRNATKADVEAHFSSHGHGKITEVKLMNGFGFLEYEDAMDAQDVVPAFHGTEFMGERLAVQFARGGNRQREEHGNHRERQPPRPRRTIHRMTITGLPFETSWQDLKDFARQSGMDVVYSEVSRERDPSGGGKGFVEYETAADVISAVEKLDNSEFKGATVSCVNDPQTEVPRPRERFRSRSPGFRGGRGGYGGPPPQEYYDDYRRGPPRGYSPRRDDYRRRSPPRYYDEGRGEDRYGGPRRGPPADDYPAAPPRRGYQDDRYGGPPTGGYRGYENDQYANSGHGREAYGRPPSPRRDAPRGGYERGGYERGGY